MTRCLTMSGDPQAANAAAPMPAPGHTRRLVEQWQARIQAEAPMTVLPAPTPTRVRVTDRARPPSISDEGAICLCRCHTKDLLVPRRPPTPNPPPQPALAQGHMAARPPGAAQSLLSRVPRPKVLRREPVREFVVVRRLGPASPNIV